MFNFVDEMNDLMKFGRVTANDIKCVSSNMDHQLLDEEKRRLAVFMNERILEDLSYRQSKGLYTRFLQCERTSCIKRVIKNMQYWINLWDEGTFGDVRVNCYKDQHDRFGNEVRKFSVDHNNIQWRYWERSDGRFLVYLNAEFRASVVTNWFWRILSKMFPRTIGNRCNISYSNKFVVTMTVWFDPYNYCKVDIYDVPLEITNYPIIINEKEIEKKHEQENRIDRFAAGRKFSYCY